MSTQEQIDADAALAMRLQEEELRTATSFMINRPRPRAQTNAQTHPRLPDRRPAPYFYRGAAAAAAAAAAADSRRRDDPTRPTNATGAGAGSGVPDRQRTPYSYVAPQGRGQPPTQPQPQQQQTNNPRAPPRPPQPTAHEVHFHPFGAGAGFGHHPIADMMEHFAHMFPAGPDSPPPFAQPRPHPNAHQPPHAQPQPHPFPAGGPQGMPDMLRMFDAFHDFFPPVGPTTTGVGGGGDGGGGTTFFMGTTDGMPGFPGGDIPAFFRPFMPPNMQAPTTYEEFIDMIERRGGNVNRGATEEEVDNLPTERFNPKRTTTTATTPSPSSDAAKAAGVDDAEKCVICLGEFEKDEEVLRLPCGHIFHKGCVAQWLRVNRTCPSCKRSIRDDDNI